jgi:hypothetical protein
MCQRAADFVCRPGRKNMRKTVIKLNLEGHYASLKELYEAMIPYKFSAGVPELFGKGAYSQIVFPKINDYNQVQICRNILTKRFSVLRAIAPAGELLDKIHLDGTEDDVVDPDDLLGDIKRQCLDLVKKTAEEIEAAGL